MNRWKTWIGFLLFTIILSLSIQQTNLPTYDSFTYYYESRLEDVIQEDDEEEFSSIATTNFQITIYQTSSGGVLITNFKGFHVSLGFRDLNHSVIPMNNIFSFKLNSYDWDDDNRSDSTSFNISPRLSYLTPCNFFFLNNSWEAHNESWSNSVSAIIANPTVNHSLCSFNNPNNGQFQATIVVNTDRYSQNDTIAFSFAISYAPDGVLTNYQFATDEHQFRNNGEYHLKRTIGNRFLAMALPTGFTMLVFIFMFLLLVIAISVTSLVSLRFGKKRWN